MSGQSEIEKKYSSTSENPTVNRVGRPRGSRNKDKLVLQSRIQEHGRIIFSRLLHWIRCNDGPVSMAAIKLALAYGYGKPPERLVISGEGGKQFVVAINEPVESFSDWERLVMEAENIAANTDASSS